MARGTRREFLKATAATAATLACAGTASGKTGPEAATGGDAPRGWRPGRARRETVVLGAPHVVTKDSPYLNASGEIAGKRFVLDPKRIGPKGVPTGTLGRLAGDPNLLSAFGLLNLGPGAKDVRIVDCEFEGPWETFTDVPDLKPGGPRYLKGIQMIGASNVRIEGCSFDRLPAEGIYFYGCRGVEVVDAWSRNCTQLLRADWMGPSRNRYVRLDRLHHADGWGAADLAKAPQFASIYRSGRAVGANAVSGFFADAEISNLTTSGEVKTGLKLVMPIRVDLDRVYSSKLSIQGTTAWNFTAERSKGNGRLGGYNLPGFDESLGEHARDVSVTRSRFRQQQNAWFEVRGGGGNLVQLSYHQVGIRFRDCVFYRPAQSRHLNQAIQAWDGVEVDVRECLFVGWKKPPHPLPPYSKSQTLVREGTYGKPGSRPSSVNADFARVNEFRTEPGAGPPEG